MTPAQARHWDAVVANTLEQAAGATEETMLEGFPRVFGHEPISWSTEQLAQIKELNRRYVPLFLAAGREGSITGVKPEHVALHEAYMKEFESLMTSDQYHQWKRSFDN